MCLLTLMDTYLKVDSVIDHRSLYRVDLREEVTCILVKIGDAIGIGVFRVIDTVAQLYPVIDFPFLKP